MKTINTNHIHYLYYPLTSMTDDELSNLQTYDKLYRSRLFNLMHLILEGLGPKIKSDISECVEYIISTRSHEK